MNGSASSARTNLKKECLVEDVYRRVDPTRLNGGHRLLTVRPLPPEPVSRTRAQLPERE